MVHFLQVISCHGTLLPLATRSLLTCPPAVCFSSPPACFSIFPLSMRQSRGDLLVQLWWPSLVDGQLRLTTHHQPFVLQHGSDKLSVYRDISTK